MFLVHQATQYFYEGENVDCFHYFIVGMASICRSEGPQGGKLL